MSSVEVKDINDVLQKMIETNSKHTESMQELIGDVEHVLRSFVTTALPEFMKYQELLESVVAKIVAPEPLNPESSNTLSNAAEPDSENNAKPETENQLQLQKDKKPILGAFEPGVEFVGIYRGMLEQDAGQIYQFESEGNAFQIPSESLSNEVRKVLDDKADHMVALDVDEKGGVTQLPIIGDHISVASDQNHNAVKAGSEISEAVISSDLDPQVPLPDYIPEDEPVSNSDQLMTRSEILDALKEKHGSDIEIYDGNKNLTGKCLGVESISGREYMIVDTENGPKAILVDKNEISNRMGQAVGHVVRLTFDAGVLGALKIGKPSNSKEKLAALENHDIDTSKHSKSAEHGQDIHKAKLDNAVNKLNQELSKESDYKTRLQDAAEIINMTKGLGGANGGRGYSKTEEASLMSVMARGGMETLRGVSSATSNVIAGASALVGKGAQEVSIKTSNGIARIVQKKLDSAEFNILRRTFGQALKQYSDAQAGFDKKTIHHARQDLQLAAGGMLKYMHTISKNVQDAPANKKKRVNEELLRIKKDFKKLKDAAIYHEDKSLMKLSSKCAESIKRITKKIVMAIASSIKPSSSTGPSAGM